LYQPKPATTLRKNMTSFERQVPNAFECETSNESIEVSQLRMRFPRPPLLRRCDETERIASLIDCSALNLPGLFQIYKTVVDQAEVVRCEDEFSWRGRHEDEWDYSWWNQDEEDWDVYNAYDHLSDEEYAEYLFDRSLSI
jgi:hypothetical protein